jgi:hypothetical protein
MRGAAATFLLFAIASCNSSSGGPELAELAISATNVGTQESDTQCTLLPVLLGGRVHSSATLLSQLRVDVVATRDAATVTLTPGDYRRRITVEELRNEAVFEPATDPALLITASGAELSVRLSADCAFP